VRFPRGLVTPGVAGGRGAVPGWGWLGTAGGGFSKLGISYPVSVSFAGCDPAACADGKSGEGNGMVLSGLWVSAPPRRGGDRDSRAELGCEEGERCPRFPRRGWGAWPGGLCPGAAWTGCLALAVAELALGDAQAGHWGRMLG